MTIIIKFKHGRKECWHLIPLEDLSTDLKRMLNMQVRELINEIEDCEVETLSFERVSTLEFLNACYRAA